MQAQAFFKINLYLGITFITKMIYNTCLAVNHRGVAQLARASVSKTEGRGFESLHPCQFIFDQLRLCLQLIYSYL